MQKGASVSMSGQNKTEIVLCESGEHDSCASAQLAGRKAGAVGAHTSSPVHRLDRPPPLLVRSMTVIG